ncbi:glycosyltransferase [Vibrio kanaloae]|uniref:glycosyltransferase n=1 Tax=Vibrio kanaloae TaxID=170673 RepID=UPI001F411DE4|nr:glycosyltransferase [Vibrio kanaloae]UIJ40657.1 glycosyltransferase [Vibrio kanaloae]
MKVTVSIVVPVYAGKEYLENLASRVSRVKDEWEKNAFPIEIQELIFVDDDSKDGSKEVLKKLSSLSWVHIVTLSKNYGQHPATVAGISHSSGDWIVTMDEDLQHQPEEILNMLEVCVKQEADILYVNSDTPVHQSYFRDLSSKYYKKIIQKLTGNPHISSFNSFRLIRGSIARSAAAVVGHESYLDVVLSWFSDKVAIYKTSLEDKRYIETGKSGYSLRKLLSHARRMLMTSDAKLLRGASYLGFIVFNLCIMLSVYLSLKKWLVPESITIVGWASQVVLLLMTISVVLIILGVISEYLSTLVQESNGKPPYSTVNREKDLLIKCFLEGEDIVSSKKGK